ncbi:hypothetical protein, partial [Polyangium sorediatum]
MMPKDFPRLRFLADRVSLLLSAALLAACARGESPAPAEGHALGGAASGAKVSPAFDLDASVRASRARFRAENGKFVGAGSAHQIAATAEGFEIVPIAPAASPRTSPRAGAPLRVKTARVTRGGTELGRGAGAGRVEADGHLVVSRGDVDEHLENRDGGVELSYSFARAPEGAGDLVIALDVGGEAFIGETHDGHHFIDAATGIGVRFGRATWIDATGKKTRVDVRGEQGRVVMRVPARVLAASAYPAVLDPLLTPEFGIDTPIAGLPAGRRRFRPAVASNGSHYLVAWEEDRYLDPIQDKRIYAARIAADGTVLDTTGFPVVEGSNPIKPALASDGNGFFLTYQTGSPFMISSTGVYGQRLDANGKPVGAPVTLSTSTTIQQKTRVAYDGVNYLVAWIDNSTGLYGRVSPAGQALDPGGIVVGPGYRLDVASNGAGALLLRETGGSGYAHRVDAQGALVDAAGIEIMTPSPILDTWDPVPVWTGQNYFIAYGQYDDDTYETTIKGTRFDAQQGEVLDPDGIAIGDPVYDLTEIDVTTDGTNAVVTWCNYWTDYVAYPLRRARVSPQGVVLDPGGVTYTDLGARGQGASNGSQALVVWQNAYFDGFFPGGYSIQARRFDATGAALDAAPILVSGGVNDQRSPSAAFDGQNFVVAWSDARDFLLEQGTNLYAARVTPAGVSLDPNGIFVEDGGGDVAHTSVAFDGTSTILGFSNCINGYDSSTCASFVNRMDTHGVVIDPPSIELPNFSDLSARVALSVGAGRTLAVGSAYDTDLGDDVLASLTMDAGGQLSPGGVVSLEATSSALSASFDGTNHLVAWEPSNGSAVRVARVDGMGAPLAPSPLTLAGPGSFGGVSTVFDGTNHVVFWIDKAAQKLVGARVSPAGALVDAAPIELASHAGCAYLALEERGVVREGDRFIVAYRACGPTMTDEAALVLDGHLAVVTSLPITADDKPKGPPSLASTNDGKVLVTYSTFFVEAPFGTARVQARVIDFTENTGGGGAGGAGGMGGAGG